MKTYIALLRGINVGGRNSLPMKALRTLLEDLGARNVQTYIQSGNVVLQHQTEDIARLAADIRDAIHRQYGFDPHVLLLKRPDLAQAVAGNPFPQADQHPTSLHLYFLSDVPPDPDWPKLENAKKDSEEYELVGRVFYLYAPDGIGRSKLAERVEKALGVSATARNWRTVTKVMAMAERS